MSNSMMPHGSQHQQRQQPAQSGDIISLLQSLVSLFTRVANRIAPENQQSTPVKFDGILTVPSYQLPPVFINSAYNQFVNSLVTGTVYGYRGNYTGQAPDFVFSAESNMLPIPLGYLQDSFLTFRVAPTSVGNAQGCIYVNRL